MFPPSFRASTDIYCANITTGPSLNVTSCSLVQVERLQHVYCADIVSLFKPQRLRKYCFSAALSIPVIVVIIGQSRVNNGTHCPPVNDNNVKIPSKLARNCVKITSLFSSSLVRFSLCLFHDYSPLSETTLTHWSPVAYIWLSWLSHLWFGSNFCRLGPLLLMWLSFNPA